MGLDEGSAAPSGLRERQAMRLATANIAILRASYDDPLMSDFVAQLDPLNDVADASPGFIWRLDDEHADDVAAEVFGKNPLLFNMSVWESVEALEDYAYKSGHIEAVRKRAKWFKKPTRSPFVLWWIDAGYTPTIADAKSRFELLWTSGPSPDAFTFSKRFRP